MSNTNENRRCRSVQQQTCIPDVLTNVLTQFSIQFLSTESVDIITFGREFFRTLKQPVETFRTPPLTTSDELSCNATVPSDQSAQTMETSDDEASACATTLIVSRNKTKEDIIFLTKMLRNCVYFKGFSADQIDEVCDRMWKCPISQGDTISYDDLCDYRLYFIESGTFAVKVNGNKVAQYANEGSFSLMELTISFGCYATIVAETDGQLWILCGAAFRRYWLKSDHKKCRTYETLLDSLNIFSQLTQEERSLLADMMVTKHFIASESIYGHTEDALGLYFIEEGTVLLKDKDCNPIVLGRGQYFGQLSQKPKSFIAVAKAIGDVKCSFLSLDAFESLSGHSALRLKSVLCDNCKAPLNSNKRP